MLDIFNIEARIKKSEAFGMTQDTQICRQVW